MKKVLLIAAGVVALGLTTGAQAQNKAIGFKPGAPFSEGQVAGNTLYVAGQQGPAANGKLDGLDITAQTANAIAAIKKVITDAGFSPKDIVAIQVYLVDLGDLSKMNAEYIKDMPDPKPARTTVQVAGLIGGAKIEITATVVRSGARMSPMGGK